MAEVDDDRRDLFWPRSLPKPFGHGVSVIRVRAMGTLTRMLLRAPSIASIVHQSDQASLRRAVVGLTEGPRTGLSRGGHHDAAAYPAPRMRPGCTGDVEGAAQMHRDDRVNLLGGRVS